MAEVIELLKRLVSIPSVNPALDPAGAGETELARFVQGWCAGRGLETHWLEPTPGRPSVVAVARGRGGGRPLMLYAHLDTVGVEGMSEPFAPRVEGGFLYGRGACDMKAGLAAGLRALEFAAHSGLAGDVLLAAVSDEEHGSIGMESVLERFRADAAILTEPSSLELCLAHRGFAVYEFRIEGRASHTSQPHLGANAVTALGRLLGAIERLDERLRSQTPHPLLGHGSAQAVLASGGGELFTTPSAARLSYERRTLPGETPSQLARELDGLLEATRAVDGGIGVRWREVIRREPFETGADSQIARTVAGAAAQLRGEAPRVVGAPYWMESALLAEAGIPAVVYGPAPHGIHAADERVSTDEVLHLEALLRRCAAEFCA